MAKIYTKNTWTNEVLSGAERYTIKENAGATFKDDMQIVLKTAVSTPGTALSATLMNNLENGLDALDTKVAGQEASSTQTLTNKRVTPRNPGVTFNATPTFNTDNMDIVKITLTGAITNMTTNMTGTPTDGQSLLFDLIDDNGGSAPYALGWGAIVARGSALPTTTVKNKRLYVHCLYSTTAGSWGCVGVSQEV